MPERVLVTGGTGVLGSQVVWILKRQGFVDLAMSHRAPGMKRAKDVEWAQVDLRTGEGLGGAVRGVRPIVHVASDSAMNTPNGIRFAGLFFQPRRVDVDGTRRLLAEASRRKVDYQSTWADWLQRRYGSGALAENQI